MDVKRASAAAIIVLILGLTGCGGFFFFKAFEPEGDFELYLDGKLVCASDIHIVGAGELSQAYLMKADLSTHALILRTFDDPLDGIDEMLVFHRALSPEEIGDLFASPLDIPTGAVGHYRFENDLTSEGGTTGPVGTLGEGASITYVEGLISQGLHIGERETEVFFDSTVLPPRFEEFTLSLWFKKDLRSTRYIGVLSIADDDEDNETLGLFIDPIGKILVGGPGNHTGTAEIWHQVGQDFDHDAWHMLTIRISGGPWAILGLNQ
jgi:hypothetical protein